MMRISVGQRRALVGVRHRLATSAWATSAEDAARSVLGLHATDPASVFLSVHARTNDVDIGGVERALYAERSLLRMLGMRRTVFVVPTDVVPVIQAACTNGIASRQRQLYAKFLTEAGIGDEAWLRDVEDATAKALAARGEAYGPDLAADEPRLRTQVTLAEGKSYASRQNITTWVLLLLAADGRIARGRPRGSWTSSQWRWSPIEAWLPGGIPPMPIDQARAELVRLWLVAFGPGTIADLRWWTGWTVGEVKRALASVKPVEVDLDGTPGLALPDLEPIAEPEPWVALLPALDPTPMGWAERSWYVGEHAPLLFDRSGNIAPTVWCDGRIVGAWTQRPSGEIVYQLLEDIGSDAVAAVEVAAARLADWIRPARIAPRTRGRAKLEQELLS